MRLLKLTILGLLLASMLVFDASAQTAKNKTKKKGTPLVDAASSSVLTDPLIPADLLTKLKLSATQKTDADKLFKEFATKLKDIAAKAPPDSGKSAKPDKGKGKGGATTASPAISDAVELRDEYEQKFEELLTDPQKKVLEEYRVKQGEAALRKSDKK